ncbi:hypothetical protein VPHD456G2_0027 [Vibrio phage D456 g2]
MAKKDWDGFVVSKADRTRASESTEQERRASRARHKIEVERDRRELAKELGITLTELMELEQ